MPLPFPMPSGDGHDGRPLPPGQLVAVEVVPADDVPRGPALPSYLEHVPAGFPSPADDYAEDRLDVHDLLGAGSPSCYFLRVSGESMTGAGILDGDVVLVDRARRPKSGAVVVASVDGEFTLKRFVRRTVRGRPRVSLLAANPAAVRPVLGHHAGLDQVRQVSWHFTNHRLASEEREAVSRSDPNTFTPLGSYTIS